MNGNVLVIEESDSVSHSYSSLIKQGYSVDLVRTGESWLQKLGNQGHDVIILQEAAESECWRLCKEIRRVTSVPIIVIGTNASIEATVKAIRAGADYFLRKPCGPLELVARIRSLLRRTSLN